MSLTRTKQLESSRLKELDALVGPGLVSIPSAVPGDAPTIVPTGTAGLSVLAASDSAAAREVMGLDHVTQTGVLPFTSTIKFDRIVSVYSPPIVNGLSAPVTFTADFANAQPGSVAIVRLMANGSNTPIFSGMKMPTSNGWEPRTGYLNIIQFLYLGGTEVWVSIAQEDGASPVDIISPTMLSAVIPNAAPSSVVLSFSEPLVGASPSVSAFTIAGKTISAISISGSTVTLTVSVAFVAGNTASISYTKPATNPLRDASGNEVDNIVATPISNQISGVLPLTFPAANRTSNISVSGVTYTNTTANAWQQSMLASQSLPANADGWVSFDAGSPGISAMIGFNTSNVNENFSGYEFFTWGNGAVFRGTNGSGVTTTATNCQRFLRLRRTAGVISAETSSDNTNWDTAYTWPGVNQLQLYINLGFQSNGVIVNPVGFGVI